MKNLEEVTSFIEKKLSEKDDLREMCLKFCRDIIRNSRKSIKKIHSGEIEEAKKYLEEAKKILKEIKDSAKEHPDIISSGYLEGAMQELAEAEIFLSIIENKDFPFPEEINVSCSAYLMGLADAVGELKRKEFYMLKEKNVKEVEKLLHIIEEISDKIFEFDYPSGLIPIKKKQDSIRRMLDRMREDLILFNKSRELENKMEEIKEMIRKLENKEKFNLGSML
ncbi:MAG: haloacid dehalogenase [Thermoplasmatales archaeon]|nr:haloacid dehalogenase [Thermoplasmatales archaeon]